jgi:nitroreductase
VSVQIPVESWYQAIFVRRSRRSFIDRLPEEEKLGKLEKVCREFRPFAGARAEFLRNSPEKVFKGIVGGYGKITGAPYYVAFIDSSGSPNTEEGIGYTGEGVILEATALGLGTCWVSGFFRPEAVKEHIALADNERVYAVTPIGYTEKGFSMKEKFYSGAAGSPKKKPLEKIVEGKAPESWQAKAIEAARIAPSASNRQPWRFVVGEKSITVRVDTAKDSDRFPKRLDCGIAMLHIELGARAAGKKGQWEMLKAPNVGRFELI